MFVIVVVFVVVYRQIKMSSPKVNNLIAVGITLAYLCVILMGVDISMVDSDTLLTVCTVGQL